MYFMRYMPQQLIMTKMLIITKNLNNDYDTKVLTITEFNTFIYS